MKLSPLCISPMKTVNRRGRDEAGSAHPSSLHKAQFQLIHSFILKKARPEAASSLTPSHKSEAKKKKKRTSGLAGNNQWIFY